MSKNRKKLLILLAVGGVLALGGYVIFNRMTSIKPESTTIAGCDTLLACQQNTTSQTAGVYKTYEASDLSKAESGQVVLFFNAKWCPSCQAANANFQKEQLPDNLTILSLDYDKNHDLKKKYGVTHQHTFVQVDADGNQIKKWSGSNSVDQVTDQLVK